jgi:hypothetical protein
LRRIAGSRGDARGLDPGVLDEVVDDAIRVVVMMRKPILDEQHLIGAFWTSARLLLRQHAEGRHRVRIGSRARQDFEDVAQGLVADQPPVEEALLARDRARRAADFISQLDQFERNVVVVMAVEGKGIKAAARSLGVPVKDVKAAHRSARAKLDRIAAIASVGRLCGYRHAAIAQYAQGRASVEQERVARAHLRACAACRNEHARLAREMRGGRFQRDALAAVFPGTVRLADRHAEVAHRLVARVGAVPRGFAEKAVETLGGVGLVKVAAGGAIVAATATIATVAPSPRHAGGGRAPARSTPARPAPLASPSGSAAVEPRPRVLPPKRPRSKSLLAGAGPVNRADQEFGVPHPDESSPEVNTGSGAKASSVQETERSIHIEEDEAYREFGLP